MLFGKHKVVCSLILITYPIEMYGISVGTKMNTNKSMAIDCSRVKCKDVASGQLVEGGSREVTNIGPEWEEVAKVIGEGRTLVAYPAKGDKIVRYLLFRRHGRKSNTHC